MDRWRQMAAETVPMTLALVGTNTDASDSIAVARRKLRTQIVMVRLLRAGSLLAQIDFDEIDENPVGVCPTVFIRAALRTVALDAERHALAGHVVALYVRAHPNLEGTQMWQRWSDDHALVNQHADEAVRELRLALAFTKASTEAGHVADSSFHRMSDGWTAWMLAAEMPANWARAAAAAALQELRAMRRAVMAECGKALILINAVDG